MSMVRFIADDSCQVFLSVFKTRAFVPNFYRQQGFNTENIRFNKKKKLQILSYTLQNCTDWWRQRFFSILFFRGFSFNKNIETCHFSLPIFIISTLLLLSVALCYNLFTPEGITVIEVSENICRKNEDFSKREKKSLTFRKTFAAFSDGF